MTTRNWTKEEFLKTSSFYWQTCTLHAGVKLDIFSAIGSESLSLEQIKKRAGGEKRNLSILLNALAAMELLVHEEDRYSNTPESARFLSRDSSDYIGYIIMHHHQLLDSWQRIDEAVASGAPVRTRSSHGSDKQIENFLMGMFNIAMTTAPAAAEKLDLSEAQSLLDLGGGPGTFAIHFCLANPELKATVFDLPSSRSFAEKTIERFELSDRIDFVPGDFTEKKLALSRTYDAAWLSHILHGEGPKEAEKIIKKAVSVLNPGGRLYIHEFILNDSLDGPLFPALFSINMMVGTPKGQSYSEEQLRAMMEKSGLSDIRRIDFSGPTQSGIISGAL